MKTEQPGSPHRPYNKVMKELVESQIIVYRDNH
jgi:hypothetical protein